jgi:hypothetical protein
MFAEGLAAADAAVMNQNEIVSGLLASIEEGKKVLDEFAKRK